MINDQISHLNQAENSGPVREARPLAPKLLSFDVFGTLVNVRDSSYAAFMSMLRDSGASDIDVKLFWEFWEERNIAHYWEPYRPYKEICELSLTEAFAHFGIEGRSSVIGRYFDGTVNLSGRASRMQATGSGLGDSIANRCYRFPPRLGMFESWKPYARRQ